MKIENALLTVSNYNRPGTKRANTTAIACHYIGNPGSSAKANRNWFESLKNGGGTKASCHYIIGLQGEILQLIPEDEISWCTNAANSYTISIEACHPDASGRFTDATYSAYVWLCADLCTRWGLDPLNGGLIRHYDVTRKVCPKWFVDQPDAWERFRKDVSTIMQAGNKKSGWSDEGDGRRFYLGNTGECVRNSWYEDNGCWYWFNGAGIMVTNVWYMHNGHWYYLGADGKMVKGILSDNGNWYYLNQDGKMSAEAVTLTPDQDGVLQYPGLAE